MSNTDRRTALLDAAVEEIARGGTRGLRVDAVAKVAGVSTALIYHHFGDRSTLLQSALEHIGTRADNYTTPSEATGCEMVIEMLLGEIQDEPAVRTNSAAWGELRGEATFATSLRPVITGLTDRWVSDIAAYIRDGVTDGSIRSAADPLDVAVQLTALVEGLSSRWLTDQLTAAHARSHLVSAATALLGNDRSVQLPEPML